MKTHILSIIAIFASYTIFCQNLVPNPSFEEFIQCPIAVDNNMIFQTIPPWKSVSDYPRTPGILNPDCSNTREHQKPRTGKVAVFLHTYTFLPSTWKRRFYIGTKLTNRLEKNQTYFVRFYTLPYTRWVPTLTSWKSVTEYSDGIGILFSDTLPYLTQADMVNSASIDHNKGIIKDTVNWTSICGQYKAKGNEEAIIIGNFKQNKDVKWAADNYDPGMDQRFSDHYIDDIEVRLMRDLLPDTVLVCKGESKPLNAAFTEGSYKWNTGATDSIITVSKAGKYSVSITLDGCVLTDSTVVVVPDRTDDVPIDTTLCKGDTIQLKLNFPAYGSYKWSTGATDSSIFAQQTGKYSVSVTNRCVAFTKDFNVNFKICKCVPFIPNAFSPNGDNLNDALEVFWSCDFRYKILRFQVFNRWGIPIYKSVETVSPRWDGTFNGQPAKPDVYVWYMEFEFLREGKTERVLVSGDVTIVE